MATYFAQSNSNINASNVWNTAANGSGSYLTWPPASGDVLMANNKTITVNVDADLGATGEVRNDTTGGATAGGYFDLAAGVTLTAKVYQGSTGTQCVRFNLPAPSIAYIVGSIYGGSTSNAGYGAHNASTGTLAITGNVFGGATSSYCHGVYNGSTGTVNITGDITGGAASNSCGAYNNSAGTVTVTGNSTGSATAPAFGINNNGTGIVTLNGSAFGGTGNVTASYGAVNNSTGTLTITGNAVAGVGVSTNCYGAHNVAANGVLVVKGFAIASNAPYDSVTNRTFGINQGNTDAICYVGGLKYGKGGAMPHGSTGKYFMSADPIKEAYIYDGANGVLQAFTDVTGVYPAASDIRYGVTYNSGSQTGTCHVPAAASVLYGVPVDATTGTATISAADIRAAIGLASANLDSQLDALPTAAENATAVWGATTREITGGTVDTLTNAPDVPSAETIAESVRTELTPELERVANCATVESTGDQLEALL